MSREHHVRVEHRRIDYILALLKTGLPYDQIMSQLEQHESQVSTSLAGSKRGSDYEVKVQKLLRTAPYVERVDRTGAYSPEDMAGYDLYADLHGLDPLDSVGVQVKSNQKGIRDFLRERVHPSLRSRGEKGVRQWLTSKRLVMINGSLTDAEIIASFTGQVEQIARRVKP